MKKYACVGMMVPPEDGLDNVDEFHPNLVSFVTGSPYGLAAWDGESATHPLIIRGLSKMSTNAIKHCRENNHTFFYTDNPYMLPSLRKTHHRITMNNVQNIGPIIDRPVDRLEHLGVKIHENKNNDNGFILVCPPSKKAMKQYGEDLDEWMKETQERITELTDRPVKVRLKPQRGERKHIPITDDFDKAYCVVTHNSNAATEAILYGVPVISLTENNAARMICNGSLNDINNLNRPSITERTRYVAHLSYCQFTPAEMRSGFAYNTVMENHS